jgi:hypothetical protein
MDGKGKTCLEQMGRQMCDNCNRIKASCVSREGMHKEIPMVQRPHSKLIKWVEDIDDFVNNFVQDHCVLGLLKHHLCSHTRGDLKRCKHVNNDECFRCLSSGHHAYDCPFRNASDGFCFKCSLPLHVLGGFKVFHSRGYGADCSSGYSDVITTYIWYLFHNEKEFLNRKGFPTDSKIDFHNHAMIIIDGLPNAAWTIIEHWKEFNKGE